MVSTTTVSFQTLEQGGLLRHFQLARDQRLLLFVALLTVIFHSAAAAQVNLSLASGTGAPGNIVNLNLTLNTTGSTLPASLQWTIGYTAADISSLTVIT